MEKSNMKPATEPRKPRVRPKRNKLSYKNRWLISCHLVKALRRAGVVCDIVVPDQCANVARLPAVDLSPRQRRDLALRCSGRDLDADLIEAEAELDLDLDRSPFKFCH
jgi:hypothetical protein